MDKSHVQTVAHGCPIQGSPEKNPSLPFPMFFLGYPVDLAFAVVSRGEIWAAAIPWLYKVFIWRFPRWFGETKIGLNHFTPS